VKDPRQADGDVQGGGSNAVGPNREHGEERDGRDGDGPNDDYMRNHMSTLQHLLSKLGGSIDDAGLMNLMAGGGGSYKARYESVVDRLVTPEDDTALLVTLEELSEMLSMSQEEHLVGFPLDTLAPVLVRTLQEHEDNPNIMLYAARVVAWLADIMPQAASVLARHDVVPVLCAPLMVITFIDVAEQCISALEKLSQHVPEVCLKQV
jgi:E3 ubiquitin-protein ligase TRIP12